VEPVIKSLPVVPVKLPIIIPLRYPLFLAKDFEKQAYSSQSYKQIVEGLVE
jgi:hypothetical protein